MLMNAEKNVKKNVLMEVEKLIISKEDFERIFKNKKIIEDFEYKKYLESDNYLTTKATENAEKIDKIE